jgi:hypothetical protein
VSQLRWQRGVSLDDTARSVDERIGAAIRRSDSDNQVPMLKVSPEGKRIVPTGIEDATYNDPNFGKNVT